MPRGKSGLPEKVLAERSASGHVLNRMLQFVIRKDDVALAALVPNAAGFDTFEQALTFGKPPKLVGAGVRAFNDSYCRLMVPCPGSH